MLGIQLFLGVIGALCDLSALGSIGTIGSFLFLFTLTVVAVHGLVLYGLGRVLRLDLALLSIASQANVGGPASALALAKSLGQKELMVPSILVGLLGYGVGSYLGFLVAEWVLAN